MKKTTRWLHDKYNVYLPVLCRKAKYTGDISFKFADFFS